MGTFEELGKRLDRLADQLKVATQSGIEKTASETKEWKKHLDELAERIKKTAQECFEKFASETKELGQVAKLRGQIRELRKELEEKYKTLGKTAVELRVYEGVEEGLKKLAQEAIDLEKKIKDKEKEIEKLKAD